MRETLLTEGMDPSRLHSTPACLWLFQPLLLSRSARIVFATGDFCGYIDLIYLFRNGYSAYKE